MFPLLCSLAVVLRYFRKGLCNVWRERERERERVSERDRNIDKQNQIKEIHEYINNIGPITLKITCSRNNYKVTQCT